MSRPTISLRSWPEQKTLPAAARITARSERSRPISLRQAMSSVISSSDSALRRCGRFRVTIAIGPSASNEMLWYGMSQAPSATAARACARSTFLRILPVEVFGSGPKCTAFGHLKCASRERQNSISSSSVAVESCFQQHVRVRHFAPLIVVARDDGGFHHRRMFVQHPLHFHGGNVLPS